MSYSYRDILNFWFPTNSYQDFWFDGSKDLEIKSKFSDLLKQAENDELDEWINNKDSLLALVILIDQFSRNIYRNNDFRKNDNKCFDLVKTIFENKKDLDYSFCERMFLLLPYRHQRKTQYLNYVIDKLNSYKPTLNKQELKMLDRFERATIQDYSKVTDTTRIVYNYVKSYPSYNLLILDNNCMKHLLKNRIIKSLLIIIFGFLLVCIFYFNIIVISIILLSILLLCYNSYYLLNNNVPSLYKINIENNSLYLSVKKFLESNRLKNVCISLSGGVDSMVLTYILYQLKLRNIINNIIAVHVDYANRKVTKLEAEYICKWVNYFNIPYVTRRIDHMQRDNNNYDRSFYEEETRKIRYGLYKYVRILFNTECVLLGHHNDDIVESDIMSFLRDRIDAHGMSVIMTKDDIQIARPMSDHIKNEIFDLAHTEYITYMKNSTPTWSFRHLLREHIMKNIERFDKNIFKNILNVCKKYRQHVQIIEKLLINKIVNKMIKYKYGFSIEISNDMINMNAEIMNEYWSNVLVKLFHSQNIDMISHENLKTFVIWIRYDSHKICQLSNNHIVCRRSNILYFINRKLLSVIAEKSKEITFNENTIVIFNGWTFTIEKTTNNEDIRNKMTIENLLNGYFTYTEPINETKKLYIIYSLKNDDFTNKIFKGFNSLSKLIPKMTSGNESFEPIGFVKITMKLEV